MKVKAIVGGQNIPSDWYRIGALVEVFRRRGIYVDQITPIIPKYPPVETYKRPVWLVAALLERLTYLTRLRGADVTIMQRELISTLPTIERLLPGNKILDVDDAIFLNRRGLAAKNAAKASIGVVCGNHYLADCFSSLNENISIIPTGVDVSRMRVDENRLTSEGKKVFGWIGTPSNLQYFNTIAPYLASFFKQYSSNTELRFVTSSPCSIPNELRGISKFVKWHPGIEFVELPKWYAGLMPLENNDWVRGKCSFKMLQYMSAGLPVVVSPFGMNAEVLAQGDIGFAAQTGDEWYQALECLVADQGINRIYGINARELAKKEYSLDVVVDKWLDVFHSWL